MKQSSLSARGGRKILQTKQKEHALRKRVRALPSGLQRGRRGRTRGRRRTIQGPDRRRAGRRSRRRRSVEIKTAPRSRCCFYLTSIFTNIFLPTLKTPPRSNP